MVDQPTVGLGGDGGAHDEAAVGPALGAHATACGERPFPLRASTGVVYWEHTENATLHELIERADARMYEDKRARKQG